MFRLVLVSCFVAAGFLAVNAGAADLGRVGKTYPVQERDALEEIQAKAAQVDWKKHLSKIKPDRYKPSNLAELPRSAKSATRLVDMTYTLDMDIPDGKGGILYPKGFVFNPLDFVPFRKTLVVINAEDKDQMVWFKKSEYAGRIDVMLLLTRGSYIDVSKSLNRPVFYADQRLAGKFDLRVVPSVVRQAGRMMEVAEVYVPRSTQKDTN